MCVRRSECGCAYLHTEINVIYMYMYVRVCKEQLYQTQSTPLPSSLHPSLPDSPGLGSFAAQVILVLIVQLHNDYGVLCYAELWAASYMARERCPHV